MSELTMMAEYIHEAMLAVEVPIQTINSKTKEKVRMGSTWQKCRFRNGWP